MKRANISKVLFFACGMVCGGLLMFLFGTEGDSSTSGKKVDNVAVASARMQPVYSLYTRQDLRGIYDYIKRLNNCCKAYSTSEMIDMGYYLTVIKKIELHLFVNEQLKRFSNDEQRRFVEEHLNWLEEWRKECEMPLIVDGEEIEGSMSGPMYVARPGILIEKYLNRFKGWKKHVNADKGEPLDFTLKFLRQ